MAQRKDYRPRNEEFFAIPCKRGESQLTKHEANIGRTRRERKKNADRIARRTTRDTYTGTKKGK